MQSALDGYNVCIFAYGQTGSGKTFTMAGNASLPGLTPRAISLLFKLAEEGKANNTVTFRASMLEIYNDKLNDLMYLIDNSAKVQYKCQPSSWGGENSLDGKLAIALVL